MQCLADFEKALHGPTLAARHGFPKVFHYSEHNGKGSEGDIGDLDLMPKFPKKKGKREAGPKHSR